MIALAHMLEAAAAAAQRRALGHREKPGDDGDIDRAFEAILRLALQHSAPAGASVGPGQAVGELVAARRVHGWPSLALRTALVEALTHPVMKAARTAIARQHLEAERRKT